MESTRVSNSKKFAMTVAKEKAVTASALILPECLEKLTCGWQMDKYLSREEDVIQKYNRLLAPEYLTGKLQ